MRRKGKPEMVHNYFRTVQEQYRGIHHPEAGISSEPLSTSDKTKQKSIVNIVRQFMYAV